MRIVNKTRSIADGMAGIVALISGPLLGIIGAVAYILFVALTESQAANNGAGYGQFVVIVLAPIFGAHIMFLVWAISTVILERKLGPIRQIYWFFLVASAASMFFSVNAIFEETVLTSMRLALILHLPFIGTDLIAFLVSLQRVRVGRGVRSRDRGSSGGR